MFFYTYVQYLLHEQMTRVHAEARKVGVVLKGDIPIGISRDSVPAWVDGRLFHFDGQAGAPPDDFAVHGQNWGFPTYNWDEMAKDHYQWWRNRLQHMQHYFDAYRIDHVLGFFRIWEVPSHQVYGLLGHFRPALPFSESEIRAWGFTADVKRYCVPRVSKERMAELVKQSGDADFQTKHFTLSAHGDYELNPEYRAQVKAWLMPESPARSLLLDAACEVLFVPDPDRKGYYHPRVGAQQTDAFAHLSAQDQAVFAHLHEDFFYHRNNQYWADEAMKKIPVVTQSHDAENLSVMLRPVPSQGMLPCAEDLGMVPASVKGVLNRLNILSLEIQRMPKEMGVRFGNVANNPYLSVATIATHDMAPLRLWWTENREQTQTFWRDALHHPGEAPQEATPAVCREIVESHLQSPSMFCLLALQDWLAISPELRSTHPEQEQINVPANPNQYWQYRMHLTLEALSKREAFNHQLKELIRKSR